MIEFEEKMQKKSTFSADYLVVSGKSSTFACFFAARERICVCDVREWKIRAKN